MSFAKRARENFFTLNGRSSADWGIVCSSDNGYDIPEKDITAIAVPGRNGELHIDNGRWQNIDVTYNNCVIESDFGRKFRDFRSWCASQKGYVRLEDTFNPDEFRLANMSNGVAVDTLGTRYNSGKFDITFNCKPQRFLKSGEIPVEIPCEPAASPASARRYWRLSSFTETVQGFVTDGLTAIGYTSSEINAMQFEVIHLFNSPRQWPITGLNLWNLLEFKGYDSDRFFAFFDDGDPTTDEFASFSWYVTQPSTGWEYNWVREYAIVKKSFGTEEWYAGEKIGQDETYQFNTIINPTRFNAVPKIRLTLPSILDNMTGATTYIVGIGQNGVALKWTADMLNYTDCVITIDADLMDVCILPEDNYYDHNFISLNSSAKFFGSRIVIAPGENIIRLDPMIAGCEIVPRWWTI